ncbi:Protein of unknown function DUF2179 [Bacteroides coprosuis DSM 18011]|uniref:DUF2179 domain-containing protein n=1 Tax=Bacteroides coprosuis DSM 18011 TaxID=679937 RepID=F3ZR41_9BACE|nr:MULTISPECIES: YitT family protein [Bacteroides]EGJ70634.1 Protein of unknown function DUF2179 [Bacteroides coprosuis DSM 18011]HJD91772.1 YitT family protein [Bacteroides coprosuis]
MATHALSKQAWTRVMRDYLLIALGIVCYSVGWALFLLPYKLPLGGTAGVATLVFYSTGFPIQYTYFMINAVLLTATFKILGKSFTVRTIFGVLVMTFCTWMTQAVFKGPDGSILQLLGPDEAFMACVIGASMCGLGLGLVFINNGSTGGTDVVAAVVNKYRDISLGRVILLCDFTIVSSSYFIDNDWKMVLMGFVTLFIVTNVLDWVVNSARQSVQFFIFSKHYDAIADRIMKETGRGVTVIKGQGWYSQNEVKVLMVLAKKSQSIIIFRLVKDIDPEAFVSQSSVIGVYGQGFDKIKVK